MVEDLILALPSNKIMAKKGLKPGPKKKKFKHVRREMKQKDRERLNKKRKQAANKKANDGSLQQTAATPGPIVPMEDGDTAPALVDIDQNDNPFSAYQLGLFSNLTKKQRKELSHSLNRAQKCYNALKDNILLVGEGNFSFAKALVSAQFLPPAVRAEGGGGGSSNKGQQHDEDHSDGDDLLPAHNDVDTKGSPHCKLPWRLLATCYDKKDTLTKKYPDAKANIKTLQKAGAKVCVNVDATKLSELRDGSLQDSFDKIVFQFPHLGSGEQDLYKNVEQHQEFLKEFFREAALVLASSNRFAEVHVTLKQGSPYSDWKIGKCCSEGSASKLRLKTAFEFEPRCFPGYAHRRTIGFRDDKSAAENEEILKSGAKTYVFGWADTFVGAGRKRVRKVELRDDGEEALLRELNEVADEEGEMEE